MKGLITAMVVQALSLGRRVFGSYDDGQQWRRNTVPDRKEILRARKQRRRGKGKRR